MYQAASKEIVVPDLDVWRVRKDQREIRGTVLEIRHGTSSCE
jgi:hypothetical protein